MAGIDQFIESVVADLGVSESVAKAGVGSVLRTIQVKSHSDDFQQLLLNLPGSQDLVARASSASAGAGESGGLLGSGLAGASAILGGGSGSALGLVTALQSNGLSGDQLGPFVSKFVEFAKGSAGQALVGKLIRQVPELAKLLG